MSLFHLRTISFGATSSIAKFIIIGSLIFATSTVDAAEVSVDPGSQICSPGLSAEVSANLILNGDFSTFHGGSAEIGELIAGSFTASVPYAGDDIQPNDTSLSIQDGGETFWNGNVVQEAFPGHPEFDLAPLETYLYSNGNNTGMAYQPWMQTIEVEADTEYLFVYYVSNMALPGRNIHDDPVIAFFADEQELVSPTVILEEEEPAVDVWIRFARTYRTALDQTTVTLKLEDSAMLDFGDDVAYTALSASKCATLNNSPVAEDDSVSTTEQTAISINVLVNDSDPDGDELTVTSINSGPANGTAVINDDGSVTYTPEAGFIGTDTFDYTITDSNGDTATATVTIIVTMLPDFDMDGIPDDVDLDDDNDGILDTEEGTGDFDGDGIPNYQDLDADGDGILDLEESGLNEDQQAALDTDGDGQIDAGNEFGNNGLADGIETNPESGQPDYSGDGNADVPVDTDQDGNPDFLDLDSDNDSIPDVTEAGLIDEDGDGLADPGQTPTTSLPDTDGDGVEDPQDLDSDNDGLTDAAEAGSTDADGDGIVDDFMDADGDGYNDASADDPAPLPDTDGDGAPDNLDTDSDGDGISDTTEAGLPDADGDGMIDDFTDADGDGLDDGVANNPPALPDEDGDGIPDVLDLDNPPGGGGPVVAEPCDCVLETGLNGHGGGSTGLYLILMLALSILYRKKNTIRLINPSKLLVSVLPASLIFAMAGVSAEDMSPEQREFDQRLYLGLAVGLSYIEPYSPCGCQFVSDDEDSAFGLHLGYDLSKRFSIEANFVDLGEAEISRRSTGLVEGGVDYQHFGVSAIGYLYNSREANDYTNGYADEGYYRREGFSVYGRVGLSTMDNSSNLQYDQQNDIQLHLGAGLEYGWENGFAVRAEYTSYDEDAQALTLGVSKRFGKANPYIVPVAQAPVEAKVAEEFAVVEMEPMADDAPPLILPIIYFATDSAMINAVEQQKINELVKQLSGQKGQLKVTGHADSRGNQDYNQTLSEKRAGSVTELLKSSGDSLKDIDLLTSGLGENSPAAANDSEPGRQRNRRVELDLQLEE